MDQILEIEIIDFSTHPLCKLHVARDHEQEGTCQTYYGRHHICKSSILLPVGVLTLVEHLNSKPQLAGIGSLRTSSDTPATSKPTAWNLRLRIIITSSLFLFLLLLSQNNSTSTQSCCWRRPLARSWNLQCRSNSRERGIAEGNFGFNGSCTRLSPYPQPSAPRHPPPTTTSFCPRIRSTEAVEGTSHPKSKRDLAQPRQLIPEPGFCKL